MKTYTTPPASAADADIDGNVPDDFPVPDELLDLIDEDDEAMESGFDPGVLDKRFHSAYLDRYRTCRDLAVRLSEHIRQGGQLPATSLMQSHILERYRTSLANSGWTAPEEAYWVMHRVALLLGWDNPATPVRKPAH
jgi:hypothetical protein